MRRLLYALVAVVSLAVGAGAQQSNVTNAVVIAALQALGLFGDSYTVGQVPVWSASAGRFQPGAPVPGFPLLPGASTCAAPSYASSAAATTGLAITAGSPLLCEDGSIVFSADFSLESVFAGPQAGFSNVGGSQNTYLGTYAGYANVSGVQNVSVGYLSSRFFTGNGQTAVGNHALFSQISGVNNTAVGSAALDLSETGIENSALGSGALADLLSGGGNTGIGFATGRGITTGSNNTILGASVTGLAAGLSNNIIIADGDGNQRIKGDANGIITFGVAYGPVRATAFVTAPSGPVACRSPAVTWSNGTATFQVDVGGTCAGVSTLAVTLPAVTNAYQCSATNATTSATAAIEMTASTTTTATFTNYTRTTGAVLAWVDGADVRIACSGG